VSTQIHAGPAVPLAPIPPAAPPVGPSRRRSPALVSLGVVLVVLGALAGWRYVASVSGGAHAYIAVYQPVRMGDRITADDLQSVTISSARGLTPIPAADADRVIGQYAAVPLVPGTLLTDADLVASNRVGPAQALLGLDLSPMQRPNRSFAPGDTVMLVAVPPPAGGGDTGSAPTPQSTMPTMSATVVGIGQPDADGNLVVDVVIPKASADVVAWYADQNRIAAALVAGD